MTINDKIRDDKLQHDINREAAKISTLSSGKVDKYKYPTGEEIVPPNQSRVIEQANVRCLMNKGGGGGQNKRGVGDFC